MPRFRTKGRGPGRKVYPISRATAMSSSISKKKGARVSDFMLLKWYYDVVPQRTASRIQRILLHNKMAMIDKESGELEFTAKGRHFFKKLKSKATTRQKDFLRLIGSRLLDGRKVEG